MPLRPTHISAALRQRRVSFAATSISVHDARSQTRTDCDGESVGVAQDYDT
jgi:hypothetical protein